MSIGGWLARLLKAEGSEPATATPANSTPAAAQEESAAGLNFRTAIEAHQKWKLRLQSVMEGKSQEKLEPTLVSRDDQCELGKWIHGAGGRRFAADQQFADLTRKHAYFHVCAGRILSLAQSGQNAQAMAELSPRGEFARVSRDVVGNLATMFVQLNEGKR